MICGFLSLQTAIRFLGDMLAGGDDRRRLQQLHADGTLELPAPAYTGREVVRRLAEGDAPPGSVVFLRKAVRTLATVAREAEAFIRVNVGRLQGVLDQAVGIVNRAKATTDTVVTVLDNAEVFLDALTPLIPDIETVGNAVDQVLSVTNVVDEVMSLLNPVISAVDGFVQTNIVKHVSTAQQFIVTIQGYAVQVTGRVCVCHAAQAHTCCHSPLLSRSEQVHWAVPQHCGHCQQRLRLCGQHY